MSKHGLVGDVGRAVVMGAAAGALVEVAGAALKEGGKPVSDKPADTMDRVGAGALVAVVGAGLFAGAAALVGGAIVASVPGAVTIGAAIVGATIGAVLGAKNPKETWSIAKGAGAIFGAIGAMAGAVAMIGGALGAFDGGGHRKHK